MQNDPMSSYKEKWKRKELSKQLTNGTDPTDNEMLRNAKLAPAGKNFGIPGSWPHMPAVLSDLSAWKK